MSNQTLPNAPSARPKQGAAKSGKSSRSSKSSRYRRQTARIGREARRDGKPLIFGWGGHLSRLQKNRIQRRAAYGFFAVVLAAVVGVGVFGLLQQNVLIPNQTIVSVNSTNISQDNYRKYLAYQAQTIWNRMQSEYREQQALQPNVQAGDPAATTRNQVLLSLIQTDEGSFGQSTITQSTLDRLTEDQLIQAGVTQFAAQDPKAAAALTVKDSDVQARLKAFQKAFPSGESYQRFLDANSMSTSDVLAEIRIDMRREVTQAYLSGRLVSPAVQKHLRKLELDTQANAAKWRAKLLQNNTDSEWNTLAKQVSLDAQSKNVGGDTGWAFNGGIDAAIGNWAFGSGGTVHALSPVIKDVSGTYDIVEVLEVNPSRPVDPSQLSAAKSDALDHWLAGQRVAPSVHITVPDTNMLTAARNLPVAPSLNSPLPAVPTPGTGAPSLG